MKRLTIEHNHGIVVLQDAVIENGYATGVCIGGGEISRLFGATAHRAFETGVSRSWPCWRKPYCTDEAKDEWCASAVSCG